MLLLELLKGINYKSKNKDLVVDVIDLCLDSREIYKGCLFFAKNGNDYNGEDFIDDAIKKGACCVICENEKQIENFPNFLVIAVENLSEVISKTAYKFYEPKDKRVKVIGVVGTNGKTTTTYILRNILQKAGYNCGIIGTLGIEYNNKTISPHLTTPDSIDLLKNLMEMSNSGVEYCVMEVSAHAIEQKRVDSIYFEGLIFTNCTHDHLDYFKTFERYKEVKKSIFNKKHAKICVVNADDKVGLEIIKNCNSRLLTYGIYSPCDVFAVDVKNKQNGVNFLMNLFDNLLAVCFKITGEFNVLNCLGSATLAHALNINHNDILKGLNTLEGVSGRMEFVENYNGADIFIDYAHTPDGLLKTLTTLRKITKNKLIIIFGCGGNRDKEKRKIMGEIAGNNADFTIITSDNPRYEEGYNIILDVEKGIIGTKNPYTKIESRYLATAYGIKMLKKGDVLVLCGKGAETEQEIMGEKISYSDKQVVKDIIAKLNFIGEII